MLAGVVALLSAQYAELRRFHGCVDVCHGFGIEGKLQLIQTDTHVAQIYVAVSHAHSFARTHPGKGEPQINAHERIPLGLCGHKQTAKDVAQVFRSGNVLFEDAVCIVHTQIGNRVGDGKPLPAPPMVVSVQMVECMVLRVFALTSKFPESGAQRFEFCASKIFASFGFVWLEEVKKPTQRHGETLFAGVSANECDLGAAVVHAQTPFLVGLLEMLGGALCLVVFDFPIERGAQAGNIIPLRVVEKILPVEDDLAFAAAEDEASLSNHADFIVFGFPFHNPLWEVFHHRVGIGGVLYTQGAGKFELANVQFTEPRGEVFRLCFIESVRIGVVADFSQRYLPAVVEHSFS